MHVFVSSFGRDGDGNYGSMPGYRLECGKSQIKLCGDQATISRHHSSGTYSGHSSSNNSNSSGDDFTFWSVLLIVVFLRVCLPAWVRSQRSNQRVYRQVGQAPGDVELQSQSALPVGRV